MERPVLAPEPSPTRPEKGERPLLILPGRQAVWGEGNFGKQTR